jgi:hypothetical protein
MRKLIILASFMCLFTGLASADASRVEIFVGGQYLHLDPNFNLEGANASFTGNVKGWLGITVDGSSSFHSGGLKFYTIAAGPELRANLPLIKPFVHGLVGGARSSGGGVSADGFVGMIGGGLDCGGGMFAFRLIQADWMATRFSNFTNKSNKNFRASAGIVIRF